MRLSLNTFGELFAQADCDFLVYDLGRRISPLTPQLWHACEHGHSPYPYPIQRYACLGIVFWRRDSNHSPFIWFIKLPLDEQGIIKPTAIHQYLKLVIEALGHKLDSPPSESRQQRLASNSFSYQPPQLKLAYFNAHVRKQLGQPPSHYYPATQAYLQGQHGWDEWRDLATQGLADFVVQLDEPANQRALAAHFGKLPATVRQTLCELLEHFSLNAPLARQLYQASLEANTPLAPQWTVRMLACCEHGELQQQLFTRLFADTGDAGHAAAPEILIAIAGRCWEWLTRDTNLSLFMEQLAVQGPQLFQQVMLDLLAIPALRPAIITAFRSPARSAQLSKQIGQLLTPASDQYH